MVPAPLALAAVERGSVADRDERVLQPGPPRMMGVDVAGRDGRHAEHCGQIFERSVSAPVAALERALQLDVERTRERTRQTHRRVRVDHTEAVPGAARERDQPFGMLGDDVDRRRRRLTIGMRVREDPAEVCVAALALAEQRDVRPTCERDLRAGDRPQPERLGGVRELERAVDPVVVGERERVVAELHRPRRELLRQRGAVQERIRRVGVQLDVGRRHTRCRLCTLLFMHAA